MYLRILYKIHVFGFMSRHLCISRILCKIHVSGYMSQHPFISQDPLQDPCLRIHVPDSCLSIFISQGPLQDPCVRIHVSASWYLRILYKIHVFGLMSQHPLVWILYKIHVFGFMSQHLCISGPSAKSIAPDPYVKASICISGSSARSMSPDSGLSIHMYLRNLCKIHVSGSVFKHPYASQDPLQDPCLRFMSQHLYISGSSARSMSPDSCLSILISQAPLQDPCLRIHVSASLYLRILCKIHVSGSKYQHPYVSQDPLQDPCVRFKS